MTHVYQPNREAAARRRTVRVLMLMENCGYPDDMRVLMESRSLCDAGYEVTVICPRSHSRRYFENLNGVRVYRYPHFWELEGFVGYIAEYSYSLVLTFVLSLWVLVRHGFDVVHSRVPPDIYVVLACFYKLLGKRYVADLQDSSPDLYQAKHDGDGSPIVHRALLTLERWSCRSADCLITINESYRKMLAQRAGLTCDDCHVVRNAPDPLFLVPVEPITELRKSGRTIIGYMGMIGEQDRVDVLLEALNVLRCVRGRDDFLGIIIGSGPALANVQARCSELGLHDHVRFVGYLRGDDLLRHMTSFDIGVTPDPSNPYNDFCSFLKTMEYMAMAKPVVCFDLPESRVTAGEAALYARPNDVADLASQIELLMDDASLREQLGAIGRRRAQEQLCWERQATILLQAYDQMLGNVSMSVGRESAVSMVSTSGIAPIDAAH